VAQAQIVNGRPIAPIALASIDGGDAYWHPRSDGDDPIAMLLDEYLPMLARRGLRTSVFGVLGWSMGGYGALLLGEIDRRATAIAAASPAIWPSYAVARSVNASAFDSAAQWDRYDVVSHARALDGTPVRVDCGRSDPFLPASQVLAHVLRPADSVHLEPGAHDATFWAARGPAQLRFLAARLA
jgi:S-formylglutathione hydrolase FrmB